MGDNSVKDFFDLDMKDKMRGSSKAERNLKKI